MERLNSWQRILLIALSCLPKVKFPKKNKINYAIDDVDYVDITTDDKTSENRDINLNNLSTISYETLTNQLNGPETMNPC